MDYKSTNSFVPRLLLNSRPLSVAPPPVKLSQVPSSTDFSAPSFCRLPKAFPEKLIPVESDPFRKTKFCRRIIETGFCRWKDECTFAHSYDELRPLPNLQKTKLCADFMATGKCRSGSQCPFAHGRNELRSTTNCYKTTICYYWNNGNCKQGADCRYAHGADDLRPGLARAPRRKEKIMSYSMASPERRADSDLVSPATNPSAPLPPRERKESELYAFLAALDPAVTNILLAALRDRVYPAPAASQVNSCNGSGKTTGGRASSLPPQPAQSMTSNSVAASLLCSPTTALNGTQASNLCASYPQDPQRSFMSCPPPAGESGQHNEYPPSQTQLGWNLSHPRSHVALSDQLIQSSQNLPVHSSVHSVSTRGSIDSTGDLDMLVFLDNSTTTQAAKVPKTTHTLTVPTNDHGGRGAQGHSVYRRTENDSENGSHGTETTSIPPNQVLAAKIGKLLEVSS